MTDCDCSDPCDCDANAGVVIVGENDFGDAPNPPNPTPGAICSVGTQQAPTSTELGATY